MTIQIKSTTIADDNTDPINQAAQDTISMSKKWTQ